MRYLAMLFLMSAVLTKPLQIQRSSYAESAQLLKAFDSIVKDGYSVISWCQSEARGRLKRKSVQGTIGLVDDENIVEQGSLLLDSIKALEGLAAILPGGFKAACLDQLHSADFSGLLDTLGVARIELANKMRYAAQSRTQVSTKFFVKHHRSCSAAKALFPFRTTASCFACREGERFEEEPPLRRIFDFLLNGGEEVLSKQRYIEPEEPSSTDSTGTLASDYSTSTAFTYGPISMLDPVRRDGAKVNYGARVSLFPEDRGLHTWIAKLESAKSSADSPVEIPFAYLDAEVFMKTPVHIDMAVVEALVSKDFFSPYTRCPHYEAISEDVRRIYKRRSPDESFSILAHYLRKYYTHSVLTHSLTGNLTFENLSALSRTTLAALDHLAKMAKERSAPRPGNPLLKSAPSTAEYLALISSCTNFYTFITSYFAIGAK